MRDKFVFYRSFIESIESLPKNTQLKLLKAIYEYGLDDKEPKDLNPTTLALFKIISSIIDRSQKSYESKSKNGRLGGAPTGNKNALKTTENNLNQPKTTENNLRIEENRIEENRIEESENRILGCFPTLADVILYSSELGISDNEYCEKFFNHYESVNWINGTGQEIKNWKLIFNNWCKKDKLIKNSNNQETDTKTIFEDEYGKYRLSEDGKRIVC